MKIALAQINPCVGDLAENAKKIVAFSNQAAQKSADLVIFPELSLLGYPPKDLLLRQDFLHAQAKFFNEIGAASPIPVIIGAAIVRDERHLPFNGAVLCQKSGPEVVGKKVLLPNYNVFDEKRYFSNPENNACMVIEFLGHKLLISICEDAWNCLSVDGEQKYDFDPIKNAIDTNGPIDVLINLSASPFTLTKPRIRERLVTHLAKTYRVPVLYVGQVGANDQWLFDGHSMIVNADGRIQEWAKACEEDMLFFDTNASNIETHSTYDTGMALVLQGLIMGVRDYVEKCRLSGVVLGLSGGIDSAVSAVILVNALGPSRVRLVYLPSRFSSPQSHDDAYLLAKNLGVDLALLPIEPVMETLRDLLVDDFLGQKGADIADQNLQSRVRGMILMALTNLERSVMVATSNKSELAVGYSTLYGDMCGAFSVIGDLYKTEVYKLAQEINKNKTIIPPSILVRPPTAELKPDQLDSDTLPPYSILDPILFNFIELEKSPREIEQETKQPRALIDQVIAMVNHAEFKRRQGPFCLMVSDKVFGDARRLPIAKRRF